MKLKLFKSAKTALSLGRWYSTEETERMAFLYDGEVSNAYVLTSCPVPGLIRSSVDLRPNALSFMKDPKKIPANRR